MSEMLSQPRSEIVEQPCFVPAVIEDLLLGERRLRAAFTRIPMQFAGRDMSLLRGGMSERVVLLIRSGFAYCSCTMLNGHRAILRLLLSGDYAGLDNIVSARTMGDVVAVHSVSYQMFDAAMLRELLADSCVSKFLLAQVVETLWEADRLAIIIGQLNAYKRLCVLLLDIHDRLRHRELIDCPTFYLPLTQEQIANHLGLTHVHVNRILRRLREERTVLVNRHVVIIQNMERLRELAGGLPQSAGLYNTPVSPEGTAVAEALA